MRITLNKRTDLVTGKVVGKFSYSTNVDCSDGFRRGHTFDHEGQYRLNISKGTYVGENRFDYGVEIIAVYNAYEERPTSAENAYYILGTIFNDSLVSIDGHAFPEEFVLVKWSQKYYLRNTPSGRQQLYEVVESDIQQRKIGSWAVAIETGRITLEELADVVTQRRYTLGKDYFGDMDGQSIMVQLCRFPGVEAYFNKRTCTKREQQKIFGHIDYAYVNFWDTETTAELCQAIVAHSSLDSKDVEFLLIKM